MERLNPLILEIEIAPPAPEDVIFFHTHPSNSADVPVQVSNLLFSQTRFLQTEGSKLVKILSRDSLAQCDGF
jgi:hypothetical protein